MDNGSWFIVHGILLFMGYLFFSTTFMALPSARAMRSYCTGLKHIGRYPLLSLTLSSEPEFAEFEN